MRLELLIAIVVVIVIYVAFRASSSHFVCPKCGASFKVGIFSYLIAPHFLTKRMVRCPGCGHTEMLSPDKK